MRPDADLSLRGSGRMVAEFLDRLDLRDVTVIGNDQGAVLALAADAQQGGGATRVGRLVISSCEAFENYPPGLPGKNLRLTAMAPGGLFLASQAMRWPAVINSPIGLGWLAKRRLPDALLLGWLGQLRTNPGVRRDLARYARGARRSEMLDVCARLSSFDRPVLVIWTPEDRVQKPEHGRRLADTLPDARLVEIADSYTLIMRDKPDAFCTAVRDFMQAGEPGDWEPGDWKPGD